MALSKAPNLPAHLSYKSCLILIPPLSIQTPIQALRKTHDRNYWRWMPHVNLIYPFLTKPSNSIAHILERIQRAVKHANIDGPVDTRIHAIGRFDHSKLSSTVWLAPHAATPLPTTAAAEVNDKVTVEDFNDAETDDTCVLLRLRSHLQEEFSECDADTRPYIPHLSIGQAKGMHKAKSLESEAETAMRDFCEATNRARIAESMLNPTRADEPDENDGIGGSCEWELKWLVDKIYIAERNCFKDRFKVVGEFELVQ